VDENWAQGILPMMHTLLDNDGFEVLFALRTNELPLTLSKI
jgi:hypothetical protein